MNIFEHFKEAVNFINHHMELNKVVFVHCAAGISRSASMIIAYLIYKYNISFEEAYNIT